MFLALSAASAKLFPKVVKEVKLNVSLSNSIVLSLNIFRQMFPHFYFFHAESFKPFQIGQKPIVTKGIPSPEAKTAS